MEAIVFFGIQGSGKGTQAKLLSDALGFKHVNIGDLFREEIANDSKIGHLVAEIIHNGDLVEDELVFALVDKVVSHDYNGIVFDGFPRTINQASYLMQHYHVHQAIYLELSETEAVERISSRRVCAGCGANYNLITQTPIKSGHCDLCSGVLQMRRDDKPQAIKRRMKEFFRQTLTLTDYFAERGLLFKIHASGTIEEIHQTILERVMESRRK